jgi:hypothetical protein
MARRWASATRRSACFSAILTKGKTWWDALGLGKKNGPERGLRTPASCRNRRITAAGAADFGEESGQPGGTIWRGKKGEMGRRVRAIYRHERGVELSSQ